MTVFMNVRRVLDWVRGVCECKKGSRLGAWCM